MPLLTKVEPVITEDSVDPEALIQSFHLPNMNNTDLTKFSEQISPDFSLEDSSEDMETSMDTSENEVSIQSQDEIVLEEVVQTDLDTQEIEIETEDISMASTSDQAVPDIKPNITTIKPLTILPKPKHIPIAVKPVGGQQLLLVQGGTAGQVIKLVSPQGQEINLSTLGDSSKMGGVKTIKTPSGIVMSQPKPVIMKKILPTPGGTKPLISGKPVMISNRPGQQFVVIQRPNEQPVKLVPVSGIPTMQTNTAPKTYTLQQAQELGLISNANKFITTNQTGKQTIIVNKVPQKSIKIIPQSTGHLISTSQPKTITLNQLKSPTKILPANTLQGAKSGQRIIFKSANGTQTLLPAGQLIQVSGAQTPGQIHQINIPGKGPQLIKFVTSNASSTSGGSVTVNTIKTTASIQAQPTLLSTSGKIVSKPITVKQVSVNKVGGTQQFIVVPNIQQSKVPIPPVRKPTPPAPPKPAAVVPISPTEVPSSPPSPANEEPTNNTESSSVSGVIRPRKPCNCTKSQCLKLYCDCFANGEFCYMCNCMNCSNNLQYEDHRTRAIKACLERNPNAFRPKIGKAKDPLGDVSRKHTKGCNCKRSGCLKNYCECYEAKIACSGNCKCIGCRNIEDSMEKKLLMEMDEKMEGAGVLFQKIYKNSPSSLNKDISPTRGRKSSNNKRQTINYITDDVIEATCQCLMTISDNADSVMQDNELTKRQIIEEFGRCLTEIISYTSNRSLS